MENRQKIKLELTAIDKVGEFLGWASVVVIWYITISNYNALPEIIPKHYNIAGEVDGFGEKSNILILPIISTIFFIVLSILNKFPHIFNHPTYITQQNAQKQYINATRLIRYLKLIIVVIFGFIAFKTIYTANGKSVGLGSWFLPLLLVLIFIPLVYSIVKSILAKGNE